MNKTMTKSSAKKNQKKIPIVIDTETTNKNPHKAEPLGIASHNPNHSFYIPNSETEAWGNWHYQMMNKNNYFIAHNGKYDAIVIHNYFGVTLKIDFDTIVAQYLLHIDQSRKLENCIKQHFGETKKDLMEVYNEATGKERKTLPENWWTEIPDKILQQYALADVEATYKLYKHFTLELAKYPTIEKWFYEVEIPLVNILTASELKGVKIDRLKLARIEHDLKIKQRKIEGNLISLTGQFINLNSSKQLQELLFKTLKLKPVKKTKTGLSTDNQSLQVLAQRHAVPKLLLQYRENQKLLSTYTGSIIDELDVNDRLHCTYNQTLTRTRRLSSNSPNLQNIPVKTETGKEIRRCFIPERGHKFLIADYDQIELRLLAHFSQDPRMLEIYNDEDGDIHAETMKWLNLPRNYAKIFNFSLVYGKTTYGLSQDFNCSETEAKAMIKKWFAQFPGVEKYIDFQHQQMVLNNGWMKSLAGLPLYCGDPHTNSKWEFQHIMRCGVNYPIQGSSQDILKVAIVKNGIPFALSVHDEIVYESNEIKRGNLTNEKIIYNMENAWKLKVPIKVSWTIADKWEK